MNSPRASARPQIVTGLLITLLVFSAVLVVRQFGHFQRLEFGAYDWLVRHHARHGAADPRIVLIEATEADIHDPSLGGWPLPDETLAQLLHALAAQSPSVIGLDIFRDLPVPGDGSQLQHLTNALLAHDNIIACWHFGGASSLMTAPPVVLRPHPERVGFTDFPVDVDVDRIVRRGLLYLDDGTTVFESLAMRLATTYLARQGITAEPVGNDANRFRLGKTVLRAFEQDDGAYVGADAAGYQLLLDFAGPSTFRSFTVGEVLRERVPRDALSGRIVLVGVTAPSVKDSISTPLRFDHRGIELHAQVVNQFLRSALDGVGPLRVPSEWQELLLLLVCCSAGSVVGLRVRKPWRLAVLIAGGALALASLAWIAFDHRLWIPPVTPTLGFLIAVGATTAHVSYQQHTLRTQLMRLFAKQVSPDVAAALWAQRDEFLEGGRPRPLKLSATVLFADIRGFTSLSERLPPHELMDWLNEFMETMTSAVVQHRGVVEKYIGDGIMAVFGIPFPRATEAEVRQDATNAVRCAFAMREALRAQNIRWKNQGRPTAELAIGICSGPLVSGSLGSADRMEYTVLGDTVNTASRLESFEKEVDKTWQGESRILVAGSTRELLDGRFDLEWVGKIKLKGKVEEVIVYRASGERPKLER